MHLLAALRGSWGCSWVALGPLWGRSEELLGGLGRSWGDLGSLFDPPRVDFGRSISQFAIPRGSMKERVGDDELELQEGALAPLGFWGSGSRSSRAPGLRGFNLWELNSGIRAIRRLQGSRALASGIWIVEFE